MLFLGYYLQHPKLDHQPMRLSDKDDLEKLIILLLYEEKNHHPYF